MPSASGSRDWPQYEQIPARRHRDKQSLTIQGVPNASKAAETASKTRAKTTYITAASSTGLAESPDMAIHIPASTIGPKPSRTISVRRR